MCRPVTIERKRSMPKEHQDAHFILQHAWGRVTRVSPENLEKHQTSHVQENPRQTACENIEAKLGKEAGDLYRELLGLRFVQVKRTGVDPI